MARPEDGVSDQTQQERDVVVVFFDDKKAWTVLATNQWDMLFV